MGMQDCQDHAQRACHAQIRCIHTIVSSLHNDNSIGNIIESNMRTVAAEHSVCKQTDYKNDVAHAHVTLREPT